ncbi:MAG: hypothetical protein OEM24_10845 [Paracoccaceae bacterium]|nr:hypothetical protein [Paracoccaceae bacterium]
MKRREFSAVLIASGLAGAGPLWANPSEEQRERETFDRMARVQLRLATQTVLITWFLIYLQGGFLGLNLTQPMPRFNENRANLGRIPLLGQFQRPLLGQQFASALLVGTLVILGSYLILLPQLRQSLRNKSVIIANRSYSWEPPGQTVPVRMGEIPTLGQMMALPRVGTAHLLAAQLLLLVNPTIVRLGEG